MARLPSRLAVAMHEAGHAIVQLATGPAPWIDYISLEEDDPDQLGRVQTQAMWQPSWMEAAHAPPEIIEQWRVLAVRDVVNYLAGPVAELRWRRYPRAAIWLGGPEMADRCLGEPAPPSHTDLGRVRRRLTWSYPGCERKVFREAWLRTEALVASWWNQIEWLGRELDTCGRINDEELLVMWSAFEAEHAESKGRCPLTVRPTSGQSPDCAESFSKLL